MSDFRVDSTLFTVSGRNGRGKLAPQLCGLCAFRSARRRKAFPRQRGAQGISPSRADVPRGGVRGLTFTNKHSSSMNEKRLDFARG